MYGDYDNLLNPTSAVFNIGLKKLQAALQFYSQKPSSHDELVQLYRIRTSGSVLKEGAK